MKKNNLTISTLLLTLILASFTSAQAQEEDLPQALSINAGVGFEYFSQTISWIIRDEEESQSKLKSYFFTFNTEFEIREGFTLTAIFGYSFSDYEALTLRELPISLELDVGKIGGYIMGGEIRKSIIYTENLEIDVQGQFLSYFGSKKEWDIPPLPVEGSAEGKPTWMRASVGPIFTYTGFESFSPYLSLSFYKLWGKFKMDQTVQDLTGSEDKKISGESSFCTSLGFIYELIKALTFNAEASLMPYKDGVDKKVMIKAIYSF